MTNNSNSLRRIQAQLNRPPVRMALLVRPKLGGPGHHYGVLLDHGRLGQRVLELQWDRGPRLISHSEFAQGRRVTNELELRGAAEISRALERARKAVSSSQRYGLLDSNCEHFARSIIERRRASWQVSTVLAIAVAIFVLPAFLKSS